MQRLLDFLRKNTEQIHHALPPLRRMNTPNGWEYAMCKMCRAIQHELNDEATIYGLTVI